MNEVTPINRAGETSADSDTLFNSYAYVLRNESVPVELFFSSLACVWIGFAQFAFGVYGGFVPAVVVGLFVAAGVTWGGLSYRYYKPARVPSLTRPLPAKAARRDDYYRSLKDAA